MIEVGCDVPERGEGKGGCGVAAGALPLPFGVLDAAATLGLLVALRREDECDPDRLGREEDEWLSTMTLAPSRSVPTSNVSPIHFVRCFCLGLELGIHALDFTRLTSSSRTPGLSSASHRESSEFRAWSLIKCHKLSSGISSPVSTVVVRGAGARSEPDLMLPAFVLVSRSRSFLDTAFKTCLVRLICGSAIATG